MQREEGGNMGKRFRDALIILGINSAGKTALMGFLACATSSTRNV